ncbi:MAG TPA: alpha/beta hydrolase-fold protein [Candidatus Saccharimonadales bacterium]|nr:alpha/beta hydrolase-fold protein [Candidatus Saccharimonadales bacterium]
MATSRPKTKLSEFTSFSVSTIEGDSLNTRATVVYKDPDNLNPNQPPLFQYFIPGANEPITQPMKYSKEDKQWEVNIDVPKDVRGYFHIICDEEIKQRYLYLELLDGEPYPWVYKNSAVPQGTLTKCLYKADGSISPLSLDNKDPNLEVGDRVVTVYLPPDYDPKRKPPYNLQITLDGDDLYVSVPTNITLDNLIAAKKIDPVIAVFIPPWHGPPDFENYPQGVAGPPGYHQNMRIKEYGCNVQVAKSLAALPGILREKFNVTSNPEQIAITGISISGEQALFTALSYPNIFGKVIAQSPAFHWGPTLLLMSELPPVDQKLEQISIITPNGLYQLNKEKTGYSCILDANEMKTLGFDQIIIDGLKNNDKSFYHAINLEQFRQLNRAIQNKGFELGPGQIEGCAESSWLPAMIERGDLVKPNQQKPIEIWLQSGGKDKRPIGEPEIAIETGKVAELLRQQGFTVSEVTHKGGHDYTHWRCGLPDALIAAHQPKKTLETKLTFDQLQAAAASDNQPKKETPSLPDARESIPDSPPSATLQKDKESVIDNNNLHSSGSDHEPYSPKK